MIAVTLPIRTQTEGNAKEHWRVKAARAKAQRNTTALLLRASLRGFRIGDGITVTLIRLAPSGPGLDPHDNLPSSMKHIVDELTDLLGLPNDRDPRVTWRYDQRRGPWGVEVRIDRRDEKAATC